MSQERQAGSNDSRCFLPVVLSFSIYLMARTKENKCPLGPMVGNGKPQAVGELGASRRQSGLASKVWPWVRDLVQIPALPLLI